MPSRRASSCRARQREGQSEASPDKLSDSVDIDPHTETDAIELRHAEIDKDNNFSRPEVWISTGDEPDCPALSECEQTMLPKAITEDIDLGDSLADAVNSLRIVLAAQ